MPDTFVHDYPFDPGYGMTRETLLAVGWPDPPADFGAFWRRRHHAALRVDPAPRLGRSATQHEDWQVREIAYRSTNDFTIRGWLVLPRRGPVERGLVVGHGYGGRDGPDLHLPVERAALLFPCFRGLSLSARPPISSESRWHVLHDIDKRDHYIIGGCVEDLWLGVSALLTLYPWLEGRVGYAGISFGGGLGALAIPWDWRIRRGHLNVPTFGNHPLRMKLPSTGSVASVQSFHKKHPWVLDVLRYYDAASAARSVTVPMHVAPALFDPMVPPPGQFSIYNALPGRKKLFIQTAGHFEYSDQRQEERELLEELRCFFTEL